MKIIKNFIAQITTKNNMKWVLVFLIVGGIFVSKTYAADTEMSSLDSIAWLLNLIVSLVSWVRIILANLAGKLMTNDLLYGSFLHLDASLWSLRNIMKNFANFALGFLVLYAIVKNIFSIGADTGDWKPIEVIKKTLIAAVLIQMSWFLMGAVVDLSTIMTSAIGLFPSQFIQSNNEFRGNITRNIGKLQRGKIKFNSEDPNNLLEWEPYPDGGFNDEDDVNKLLDTIMPSYDSVSGPLLFLGLAIFDFNDFKYNYNSSNADQWKDVLLSLSLSAIVIIFFSIMMLFIFIFNLFRIIILWLVIPLLPIIALIHVFKLTDKLKGDTGGMDISQFLDIKNILTLVFKPVLMVGTLSLILIILVLIKSVIAPNKVGNIQFMDQPNMMIESVKDGDNGMYKSTIKSEGIMEFSMSGVKDTIADLIVYFFGLFLIYFLVKMVINTKTGIGFIDNSLEGMFKSIENLATSLPIIPIGSGGVGINAVSKADIEQAATRLAGIDVSAQTSNINKLFNLEDNVFKDLDTSSGKSKDDFIKESIAIAKNNGIDQNNLFNNADYTKKRLERKNNNPNMEISEADIKNYPKS